MMSKHPVLSRLSENMELSSFLYYFVAFFAPLFGLIYLYFARDQSYWQNKNIPCANDFWPIVGHAPIIPHKRNLGYLCTKIYRKYPRSSMIGFYHYRNAGLVIRDLDLVKSVLITNFGNFAENDIIVRDNEVPLLAKNPFFTTGNAWKTGRTRLTTSLTGNKLKVHALHVKEMTKKFKNYVDTKIKDGGTFETDAKVLFSRVTAEIAASVGFGIEGFCFDESKDKENFLACGRMFFSEDLVVQLKMILVLLFPWLFGMFKIQFIPQKFEDYFKRLVQIAVDKRNKSEPQMRHFVDTVLELEEKEGNPETRDRDVTSHMFSFFLDTFETTSMVMTFVSYHLCIHKDIQEKVRQEVMQLVKKHGEVNYDLAVEMDYFEQVLKESLRLFPLTPAQIKKCTQEIEFEGSDGLKCKIDPGVRIYIPVEGIHKNPEIWDEPEVFRPERFSKENMTERNRLAHLSFGEGPRMCPGRKFGTLVNKMTFATLLMNYELELSNKTKLPIELDSLQLVPYVKGGLFINIKKI